MSSILPETELTRDDFDFNGTLETLKTLETLETNTITKDIDIEKLKESVKVDKYCLYEKRDDGKYVFDAPRPVLDEILELVNLSDMGFYFYKKDKDEFKNFLDKYPFFLSFKFKKPFKMSLLHAFTESAKARGHYSTDRNDLCKMILERKEDLLESNDALGSTPLIRAVESGNIELVDYLVNVKKANKNVQVSSSYTTHVCILLSTNKTRPVPI